MSRYRLAAWVVVASLAWVGCKAAAPGNKSISLCDFEKVPDLAMETGNFDPASALKKPTYPAHDFRWATSGYAKLEPFTKTDARRAKNKDLYKMIQGKTAAQVRFSVPGDYRKAGDELFPKTWETGLTLSIDSHTPLAATDWAEYGYVAMDVDNLGKAAQKLWLRVSDSSGNITATAINIEPGISTIEFPLGMLSASRLNTKDIKSLSLVLDTAGQKEDPRLIVDSVGLHQATVEERIRLASEEGETEEEEEDWDAEEEDAAAKKVVKVTRPEGVAAPTPVSSTAK